MNQKVLPDQWRIGRRRAACAGVDARALGYECVQLAASERATLVVSDARGVERPGTAPGRETRSHAPGSSTCGKSVRIVRRGWGMIISTFLSAGTKITIQNISGI